ncbi:DUF1565 domain-containing protein [Clostridium sp. OS1-26]|uniref:DUF1565 domain-containing protein n=1 Tax=Clostridium sp. OS1-26 TaxID=3070681 RepID=UPI0027DF0241|nr:DUF1565 domain-containing protein [Clostridium sp. OS1-26]WML35791.1 DUF1565 domain-containing protein [Clostridium sp. OS1-26]
MKKIKVKNMVNYKIFLLTFFIILSFQFFMENRYEKVYASAGKTYYVSPQGNDSYDGSFEKPYKTIQKALDELKPGDTLEIRGGIYHETTDVYNKKGSSDAWFTIKNYKNEEVTMTGDYKVNWGEKRHQML